MFVTVLPLFLLLFRISLAYAQDFSIPTYWKNATSQISRADRINIAQSGLGRVRELFNTTSGQLTGLEYWDSPQALAAFALKDYIAGTRDNAFLIDGFVAAARQNENFNGTCLWAMGCVYAHRAYNDDSVLKLAEAVWSDTQKWVLTSSNVQSGSHPSKDPKFSGTCEGKSLEGGVFYSAGDRDDIGIACITVLHVMVSAHLAELTKDTKYRDAAILSAKFTQAHLIDSNSLVINIITPTASGNCKYDTTLYSTYAGWAVEAFSVLADVTGDSSWRDQALQVLSAATRYSVWADADGVLRDGTKDGWVRSLYEPYRRNTNNAAVRNLIQSHVNVQYNAMLTFATTPGSNLYASDWHAGPPPTTLTREGVKNSLGLLAAGIVGADTPLSTTSSVSSSASSSGSSTRTAVSSSTDTPRASDPARQESDSSTNVTAIAAGVAVPVAILLIALIAFLLWRRKRRDQGAADVSPREDHEDKFVTTPGPHIPQVPWAATGSPSADQRYAISQAALEASWASPAPLLSSDNVTSNPNSAVLTWQGQQPSSTTSPTSSTRPPPTLSSAREEKRALQAALAARNYHVGDTVSQVGPSNSGTRPLPAPSSSAGISAYNNLPTEELVRMLNQRLQPGEQAGSEELPPDYDDIRSQR